MRKLTWVNWKISKAVCSSIGEEVIFNSDPLRACVEGLHYTCVSVCMSVSSSVTKVAATLFISMLKAHYTWVSHRLFLIRFLKKPSVQKLRKKGTKVLTLSAVSMYMYTSAFSRATYISR